MEKGEAQEKGEAEVEQVAESVDHEKWGNRRGDRVNGKENQLQKGKAWEKERLRWKKQQNQQTLKKGESQSQQRKTNHKKEHRKTGRCMQNQQEK